MKDYLENRAEVAGSLISRRNFMLAAATGGNKSFELQVMGIFEVRHAKIDAWRDYFDMNQFTSRMG